MNGEENSSVGVERGPDPFPAAVESHERRGRLATLNPLRLRRALNGRLRFKLKSLEGYTITLSIYIIEFI